MQSQVFLQGEGGGGWGARFERRGRRQWDDGSRCRKDDVKQGMIQRERTAPRRGKGHGNYSPQNLEREPVPIDTLMAAQ